MKINMTFNINALDDLVMWVNLAKLFANFLLDFNLDYWQILVGIFLDWI